MANRAIGIDFGHAHIKLVELRRRGRQAQLVRAVLLPVPPGALRQGAIAEPSALSEALAEVYPAVRMQPAAVVAGITGPQVTIRTLVMETDPAESLELAVKQELGAMLRLEPPEMEDLILDYHLLAGSSATQQEVAAVGISRHTVMAYVRLLREARLAPHVLDVEALALPRALPLEGRACYLEIGAEYTQVLVTSDGEYVLHRLIPAGMSRLTAAVATAYNVSPAEASVLRLRTHIDKLVLEAPGDRTGLQGILQEISGGLLQTLEFWRARQRASSIGELLPTALLCGGGAMQPGMAQLLSEELGLPVEAAHPLGSLPGATGLHPTALSLEPLFAGALGLALRGVEEL